MGKGKYCAPVCKFITIEHHSLICTSTIKCPNCGSTDYFETEVPDKEYKIIGWGITAITSLINPSHAAHMAHHAAESHPMKKIRICKRCKTKWDAE